LEYVRDSLPGIRRRPAGRGFYYVDAAGAKIRSKSALERIRRLAIPPAWTNVWICPLANGHLQAVGMDAKKRKQYRYHPAYRAIRDQTKFNRLPKFARTLPAIRRTVAAHLAGAGLSREKVLALLVRLLEATGIRVGNKASANENHSFGLTTLRNRHVKVEGCCTLRLHFVGKSGVRQELEVNDARVARIVRLCHELPGQHLFQYEDETGVLQSIGSADVNEYLRTISGNEGIAKDFRTWSGTVHCALALQRAGRFKAPREAKKNIQRAILETAEKLGNRPATCSAYYIHPAVVESYLDGSLLRVMAQARRPRMSAGLQPVELAVLRIIEDKAKRQPGAPVRLPSAV
jgi:DNA topoisomerase-1